LEFAKDDELVKNMFSSAAAGTTETHKMARDRNFFIDDSRL
jgi:hypothetical protein